MMISLASRRSPLAIAQVDEVWRELDFYYTNIHFECTLIDTIGDIDQTTSLRTLDKSNFFTKELDDLVLAGICRIAIHSAKDLPDPLPVGLTMIALTKGVDSSDALVLKPGFSLSHLPEKPVIATSSVKREIAVKQLIPHACFTDIRGAIHQRLNVLESGKIDGVVIAEAALIRLQLTHLNRCKLPGETTPFQGQLAVIARNDDHEMGQLFHRIDSRKQR